MSTIAVVTADRAFPTAQAADQPLLEALRARGARTLRPSWRDPQVAWDQVDVAVVRSTWDYVDDRDAYVAWAAEADQVTSLWNPADVLRWNSHKGHLLELEERGAPVVPTAWLGRGDRVDLEQLRRSRGWGDVVLKPAVGNGSDGLRVVPAADTAGGQPHLDALLAAGDAMVQPLLSRVATDGELSVLWIDGEVTHLVVKTPAAGEVRVNGHLGGRTERVAATGDHAEAAALARWVVEATAAELLYARVDLLRADDGTWQVGEVELTEPDLYLGLAPEAADRLADALVARAG